MRWLVLLGLVACGKDLLPLPPRPRPCVEADACAPGEICVGGFCEPGDADVDTPTEAAPELLLLTESVRFVDVPKGAAAARQVRLRNVGEGTLRIDSADVVGASGRLTVSPRPSGFTIAVAPQGEFEFAVTLAEQDGATVQAQLALGTNDPRAPVVYVPVSIEYTGAPALVVTRTPNGQWAENLAASRVAFGPTSLGGGRVVTLFVKNLGRGGAFALLDPPTLVGDAGFSLSVSPEPDTDGRHRLPRFLGFCDDDGDCQRGACGSGVCDAEAGVLTLHIALDIPPGEERETELRVPFSSPQGTARDEVRLTLTAFGVAPGLWLPEAEIAFGDVSVGFPVSRLARVTNASPTAVTVEEVGFGSPLDGLSLQVLGAALPRALAPFDELWVRLDATARVDALGERQGAWVVRTSTLPELVVPVSARLRRGPVLATSPMFFVDVGEVHVGAMGEVRLNVANVAGPEADPLRLDDAYVHGDALTLSFAPTAIAAGDDADLDVKCTPTRLGEAHGQLTLVTDAPDNGVRTLSVRCVGTDPTLHLVYEDANGEKDLASTESCRGEAAPCWDVGALYVGGESVKQARLRNTGVGALIVETITVEPANAPFVVDADVDQPLAPGGEAVVTLGYAGGTAAPLDVATLVIKSNDADRAEVRLTLVGSQASCAAELRDCSFTSACASTQTSAACCKGFDDVTGCGPSCAPCPGLPNTVAQCLSDACHYACAPGFWDLNGAGDGTGGPEEDGCEYACTPTGAETCDGLDNDCDGTVDVGLVLSDPTGEAPSVCTPATQAGLIGVFDEEDFAVVTASGGAPSLLTTYVGHVYPAGDVDWLRLLFGEEDACSAQALRLELDLAGQARVALELCAVLHASVGGLYDAACASDGELTCVTTLDATRLVFEWPELCGLADDRVLDVRVRAVDEASASCEPYELRVYGARLE